MIDVSSRSAFDVALRNLVRFKVGVGRGFKGRFTQIFLGLKFFSNSVPSMYSGSFVGADILQTMLDDLYAKSSRPADDCVLMLFEGSYLARTGIRGRGNRSSQNTWRNNFYIQKGVGCYASVQDLSSGSFLDERRAQCRYLQPGPEGGLSGGTCRLSAVGSYRNEDHRKWLRIDPGGNGFAIVDLLRTETFAPYIAPSGNRLPIVPLIVALYHDASTAFSLGTRSTVSIEEFQADFNFGADEFSSYFDASASNPFNGAMIRELDISYTEPSPPRSPPGMRDSLPDAPRRRRRAAPIPFPSPAGTPVAPPTVNSGFEAETFVRDALMQSNWKVHHVSRQQLGYDLIAEKGQESRFIEVKSSLATCSPSLTAREWQQAQRYRSKYVLAIIENFNSSGVNTVYWICDPARCVPSMITTQSFQITRSSWIALTCDIRDI